MVSANSKLVYIIVPVYNVEKYLRRCLDSLFSQTYKEYLVICVNDGSTDNSLSILEEYKKKYSDKLVLISKENGGLSSARNAGLDYIKDWDNSYITFVDSDDWVSNDYLEVLVTKLEEIECDILCSSYYGVQETNGDMYLAKGMIDANYNYFDALKLLFGAKIQSHSPCKLYKLFIWKDIKFDETKCFMEDQVITFQLFQRTNKIATTDWAGYYYLHRLGSLCQSHMSNKKIISALNSYIYNYNFEYKGLNDNQVVELKQEILQLFADIYLMMYPRFDKKTKNELELLSWKQIITFQKQTKAVRNFKPTTKKQLIKKWFYLLCKPFYKILFILFKKEYD